MHNERRRFARQTTAIRVELSHPSFGTMVGFTRDISDGGAAVQLDVDVLPPVGTEVFVVFHKIGGQINNEPVGMRVMHHNNRLLGLMFIPRGNVSAGQG